ncbi:hypothetical protein TIFTF001_007840 [Ficus carica]|uniref:Secreted protein n=1 Tax=Ficus carica TaxID=3494 RepID=A0AA87ZKA2_FICCA|nr:hypothetical protein TIFTF001_007840 [Ficus carica]
MSGLSISSEKYALIYLVILVVSSRNCYGGNDNCHDLAVLSNLAMAMEERRSQFLPLQGHNSRCCKVAILHRETLAFATFDL